MRIKPILFFLVTSVLLVTPVISSAQVAVGLSVHIGPPALPVYVQPPCPEPGYLWTPGYWAYGPDGYYWVPGAWVAPPAVGLLWTPGYWGFVGGAYVWHGGYWGPHVGFYGGINYGFGYGGVGFVGGYWRGGGFFYNRSVANVNVTVIHNTYINNRVVNRTTVSRVSFNGGRGGINARPTAQERQYANERHEQPTGMQTQHEHMASTNRSMLASANHGRPAIAATSRAGEFSGKNVVAARQVNAANHNNNNNNRGNSNKGNSNRSRNNNSFNKSSARVNNNAGSQNHGGSSHGGSPHGGSPQQSSREHGHK
jgi:hypothetical protein